MINFLLKTFDHLNSCLFEAKLATPLFEVKIDRDDIFYFVKPNTIQIGSAFCAISLNQVIDELLHCMIHIRNHQEKLPDHTVNQYHNQHFANVALGIGMTVQKQKSRGWSLVSVSSYIGPNDFLTPDTTKQKNLHKIVSTIKLSDKGFCNFQTEIRNGFKANPKRQFLLKYTCSCHPPHNTIRSGRRPDGAHPLNVTCNICGQKFSHS